ncbi:MAG: aminoacyl-tRNA hydrolase [Desulfovibrio sp.]|jgi:PTH1 family peptidyl-tRNA hydrolase|nr:aminoacyl-tRNA hydrolase [Desulfovibrio sp.]
MINVLFTHMEQLNGLITGLGNPGKEYASTRHNYGFILAEALLEECARSGQVNRLSGRKDCFCLWRCSLRGKKCADWLVATPLTFMNKSGEAVQRVSAYYHISPQQILVLHDELDIPPGRMKLKTGGGHAGHNGVRSVQHMLGTPDFHRLRLGIGKPAGYDTVSYVLGRFSTEEQSLLSEIIPAAVDAILIFMEKGMRSAQQFCNAFVPASEKAAAPLPAASTPSLSQDDVSINNKKPFQAGPCPGVTA